MGPDREIHDLPTPIGGAETQNMRCGLGQRDKHQYWPMAKCAEGTRQLSFCGCHRTKTAKKSGTGLLGYPVSPAHITPTPVTTWGSEVSSHCHPLLTAVSSQAPLILKFKAWSPSPPSPRYDLFVPWTPGARTREFRALKGPLGGILIWGPSHHI